MECTNIEVCLDCLLLLANGEKPDDRDIMADIDRLWPDQELVLGWANDGDSDDAGELGFSWHPCEGCGSVLGGDRFKACAIHRVEMPDLGTDTDELWELRHAVSRLVPGIVPSTSMQAQHYIDTGRICCPHGTEKVTINQLLPVYWPSDDGAATAGGAFDYHGQVGPVWFCCTCNHLDLWWPPAGWREDSIEYV